MTTALGVGEIEPHGGITSAAAALDEASAAVLHRRVHALHMIAERYVADDDQAGIAVDLARDSRTGFARRSIVMRTARLEEGAHR